MAGESKQARELLADLDAMLPKAREAAAQHMCLKHIVAHLEQTRAQLVHEIQATEFWAYEMSQPYYGG